MMRTTLALTVLGLLVVAGCGDDDDSATPAPTATASPVATATATEVPTAAATATPDDPAAHRELRVGSVDEDGGALDAEFEYDRPVSLFFDTCLGGTGDGCTGGLRLYSAVNPGFVALGHSHEDESEEEEHGHGNGEHGLFPLVDGTQVSLELIAIDAGLRMRIEGTTLDQAGQVANLGEAPHFHSDAETLLSLADDQDEHDEFQVSFRLISESPAYQPSDPLTVSFTTAAGGHAHDDEHEHD